MIISGGSRCNWRFFSKHLMKLTENDYVRVAEIRGLASDNVLDAFREMDALASGTQCKNFFYHANINPREDEHLTADQWDQAVDELEKNLGLEGHSRFVVEHEKLGRTHRHVIWSRVDVDTMTVVSDSRNFARHEKTARELEKAFGHEPVQGVHGRDTMERRPPRRAKNWETFRGHKSGVKPETVTREVTALWHESDSGKAFAAAVAERGYILCKGDRRDFCLIDPAGNEHSLARRIDGEKAASVRARLSDIDRDALPTVPEARAAAENAPTGSESVRRAKQDKAMDSFMRPVIHAVEEVGETAIVGMGESRWERASQIIGLAAEKAAGLWQAAKRSWGEFIRAEERGRGRDLDR